jgi:hypothetical protein
MPNSEQSNYNRKHSKGTPFAAGKLKQVILTALHPAQ